MKRIILTSLVIAATATGCSAFAPRTTAAVKSAVAGYCAQSPEQRSLNRAILNAELPPGHGIKITCPADQL